MPELTVSQLAALDARGYTYEIRMRLRDDERWVVLLDPALIDRTRYSLTRLVESIDIQKARIEEPEDPNWLRNINRLRGYAMARLTAMAPVEPRPVSGSKEARAWRAFSARLARALRATNPELLDALRAPYDGMTASEWLAAREEKKEMAR